MRIEIGIGIGLRIVIGIRIGVDCCSWGTTVGAIASAGHYG